MPSGSYFSFNIQIGEKRLQEYDVDSKQYISVDLHSANSYIVEEVEKEEGQEEQFQKYPVTPFKINIQKEYVYPCWVTIYMDGERVSSFPIAKQGRCSRTVDGHKSGNEIRELAFSLPRISSTRTLTKSRQDFAGTFVIVCQEAIPHHMETVRVPKAVDTNTLPQTTAYPQLTKRDVSNVQGGMGVVCREGRTFKQLQYDNNSYRKRVRLTRGPVLEEITLYYRSKEVLQEMGVVSPDVEQEMTNQLTKVHINGKPSDKHLDECEDKENDASRSNNTLTDSAPTLAMKEELLASSNDVCTKPGYPCSNGDRNTREVKQEQINMITSTPFGKVPSLTKIPQSPISIKHEQMRRESEDADLIEIKSELLMHNEFDDDVVYVETTYIKREPGDRLDDSVICMGDDSCCEVEIPEEEISVMDLCEED